MGIIVVLYLSAFTSCSVNGAPLTSYASMKNQANQANMASSVSGELESNDPTSAVSWMLAKGYAYKDAIAAAEQAKALIAGQFGYKDITGNNQAEPMTPDQYIAWKSGKTGK